MIAQVQHWNNKDIILLMYKDGSASAQMHLYPEVQNFGGTAWIWDLWTDPVDRNKGMASMVLHNLEAIAKREGHKSVFLEWELKNSERWVLEWYERRGYEVKEFDGRGSYCLMEKKL
jgi:ribosomal protein S18 acetylase RimI-like enzyme